MWIKVCGIRDCETARQVSDLDINAIGLNFYSRSPRSVTAEIAKEICQILPRRIARVGLFVNHDLETVVNVADSMKLDYVQLHGDETPDFLAAVRKRLPDSRLIRAWRMKSEGLQDLAQYIEQCRLAGISLAGCLVDANVAGLFGGSGHTLDWGRLRQEYDYEKWPPLILAGGLTPENVAQAIAAASPWGVDVASGVESSPGIKDLDLIRSFVTNGHGT